MADTFHELRARYGITPENNGHARYLASLLDTYGPEKEALLVDCGEAGFESFYATAPTEYA